ncbi:MAG: YigZ family protein [Candidatus Zixiibacteriota bacterium]
MNDRYLTISDEMTVETKVKASRFIGQSFLANSVAEATEKLGTVRKREFAAGHHCFAYRIGTEGTIPFKYSDDGEPTGTAGKPIYDVILGHELTNVLLVVTRYFGGTKLGTGGLTHAYSDTARQTIERSGVKENFITNLFRIDLEFSLYDRWRTLAGRLGAREREARFDEAVHLIAEIRRSKAEELKRAVTELTAGKARIEPLAE